jgi:hypothetical protein
MKFYQIQIREPPMIALVIIILIQIVEVEVEVEKEERNIIKIQTLIIMNFLSILMRLLIFLNRNILVNT